MKKIKILFLITRATRSGPIQVIENILDYVDTKKFELYLISIEKESNDRSILESFKKQFYEYQYIPVSKANAVIGRFSNLRRAIKRIEPDVIHSNGIVPDLIIDKICPERQLMIAHANYHVDYYYLCGKLKGELMASLHIHIMKKARMCIACSESISRIYKDDGLDIPFIRNGVQVDALDITDKRALRAKLGLPIDRKIYVYAASFNTRKNQKFLLSFFEEKLKDEYLLLLGDGPTFNSLRHEYNTSNIIFAGRKSDVKPYLRASDYFISSSLQEGMPMGVLEGMAQGLPVILSDIDQHLELFEVNSEIGVVFKNGSIKSLGGAIDNISKKEYHVLSQNAYQTVLSNFNSRTMSLEYQKKYEEVAKSNR